MDEPGMVVDVVAEFFGTTRSALASRSRRRSVLEPRQVAMYLCRRHTNRSLSEIGRVFNRNHPAVHNAVRVVECKIGEGGPLTDTILELSKRLGDIEVRHRGIQT